MADSSSFNNLVPGFDFLQTLVKNTGAAMPSMGQWVAPTLNPEELQKRIDELKTVQFWLEQNARLLGATIQALEVQRMTLSTLKTMNVQMGDLREAMTIRMPGAPAPAPAPASAAAPAPAPKAAPAAAAGADASPAASGMVDPMQWWGALTKQFTELAATAMKEGAANGVAGMPSEAAGTGAHGGAAPPAAAAKPADAAPAKRSAPPRR